MQREVRTAWAYSTAYDRSLAFLLAAGRYIIAVANGLDRSAGNDGWIRSSWAVFGLQKLSPPDSLDELLGIPVQLLRDRGINEEFIRSRVERIRAGYEYKIPVELSQDIFIHAIVHAINSVDLMRVCRHEECPAPYFFALKRNQRYCSGPCAVPSQREFKRKWWQEHGNEWRANRTKKSRSKDST
jgi:hypothetical protein